MSQLGQPHASGDSDPTFCFALGESPRWDPNTLHTSTCIQLDSFNSLAYNNQGINARYLPTFMIINILFLVKGLEVGWKYAFKLQRKNNPGNVCSCKNYEFTCISIPAQDAGGRVISASTFFIINDHGYFQQP